MFVISSRALICRKLEGVLLVSLKSVELSVYDCEYFYMRICGNRYWPMLSLYYDVGVMYSPPLWHAPFTPLLGRSSQQGLNLL